MEGGDNAPPVGSVHIINGASEMILYVLICMEYDAIHKGRAMETNQMSPKWKHSECLVQRTDQDTPDDGPTMAKSDAKQSRDAESRKMTTQAGLQGSDFHISCGEPLVKNSIVHGYLQKWVLKSPWH